MQALTSSVVGLFLDLLFYCLPMGLGDWAAIPGGSAIPGRPVAKAEQAPGTSPVFQKSV